MRGSFSIDLLLGLIVLWVLSAPLIPDWSKFQEAGKVVVCSYITQLMDMEGSLSSSLGMEVNFGQFSSGSVSISGNSVIVNGGRCT